MKKKKYLKIAMVLLIVGGGYYWYSATHKVSTEVKYVTSKAQKEDITTTVTASGNVTVDQIANIDPTITGTVTDLAVNVGDKVEKGDFLFNIDNEDLGVSVDKAKASLQEAQNSVDSAVLAVKDAKANYDAAKQKDDSNGNSYTTMELSVLKGKIAIAELGVTAAQKNYTATYSDYKSQITDAGKRKVTASISGTVNEINIKNGDDLSKLSSGSSKVTPIIIGDLGTMKAEVQVNEVDISKVSVGQKANLTFDGVDDLSLAGKVEKMDSIGTLTSGVVTYNVVISLDSIDQRIKPEMSVSAEIITDSKQDVVVVPSSAIKTQNGEKYVQVLVGQVPENRTVKVGLANSTSTEVTSGVNVGDNIVTQTINPSETSTSTTSTKTSSSSSSKTSSSSRQGGPPGGGMMGM